MSTRTTLTADNHLLLLGPLSSQEAAGLARSFHRASPRRSAVFLRTLPPDGVPHMLLESELFGHAVRSFEGAFRAFAGALERVGTGTLFIERIDLLPDHLVKRLEHALHTGWSRRIGETGDSYEVQCRLIGAASRACTMTGLHILAARNWHPQKPSAILTVTSS